MKRTLTILITTLLITALLPIGTLQPADAANPGSKFDSALEATSGRQSYTLTSGEHFFKIELLKGQTVSLRLNVPDGSNYDMFLYDPDENLLGSSEQPNYLDESIQLKAEVTGFHFVKVKGIRFFGSGVYELTVLITDFKVVNVDWGTSATTPEVGPGDVGIPLQVTIRNGVSNTIEDLTATLNLSDSFSNSTGGSTVVTYFSDQILQGKTGIFTFTLNVAEDAAIGSHSFSLDLNYKIRVGSDLIEGSPEDLAVTVFLLGKVNLAVSTETVTLTPGETSTINLQFKNTGSATATGVEV
ncbi:MAG: hypothetical protein V3W09_02470, partial [Nitrososphaerales archaeon]